MSNKTQLQTNNTTLDTLITRVNAAKDTAASLPEAGSGSGGGASVETANVTVTGWWRRIAASVYTNGSISSIILTGIDDGDISNVVRGSAIFIVHDYSEDISVTGATKIDNFAISEMDMIAGSTFQVD